MKIIDLLNKMAKGEEVPKKIITLNSSFEYNKYDNDYYCGNTSLFTELVGTTDLLEEVTPVEIIEEDKKIRNLKTYYDEEIEEKCFYEDGKSNNNCIVGDAGTEFLIDKINELIDEVNKLKED